MNDVEYYNKEIIKKKQRYNKDIAVTSSCSFGLGAYAPQVNQERALAATLSLREGQEEAEPDFSHVECQAPTSHTRQDLIKSKDIKRAIVQYYQNSQGTPLQRHKLKIRLNCDFGQGEESVEFIAALTQDLGNFKKYHPEESRQSIQAWVDEGRTLIKSQFEVRPYLGKFHNNYGWRTGRAQVNQIEPWCACLLWYNRQTRTYWSSLRVYAWEEVIELGTDTVSERQRQANVRAQRLWYNPEHLDLERPKTWAQQRFGVQGA